MDTIGSFIQATEANRRVSLLPPPSDTRSRDDSFLPDSQSVSRLDLSRDDGGWLVGWLDVLLGAGQACGRWWWVRERDVT